MKNCLPMETPNNHQNHVMKNVLKNCVICFWGFRLDETPTFYSRNSSRHYSCHVSGHANSFSRHSVFHHIFGPRFHDTFFFTPFPVQFSTTLIFSRNMFSTTLSFPRHIFRSVSTPSSLQDKNYCLPYICKQFTCQNMPELLH